VKGVKRAGAEGGDRGGILIVKVSSKEKKRRILQNKWKLKGEEMWIEEDLTWEERRMKWKIRQFAIRKEIKEKRVRIKQEERESGRDG